MLITAKGPSLAAFGVTGALADPSLDLFDASGRQLAANDNIGTPVANSELAGLPGVPRTAAESAVVVVLAPGNYTVVISGNGGTGIALFEATDLRIAGGTVAVASTMPDMPDAAVETRSRAQAAAMELCTVPSAMAAKGL